ncbi:oligogalacturonate lyase family protein [Peribacillus sp. NPDC097675]|uniref:oligogalacturonate lyase family protein n=1 Tax=Peribacillus sp. NPDC097675 TaxID=3390618 RepID=UPI003D02B044
MIGSEFSSEIKQYKDKKTGREIFQLTGDGSNNFHFYFTDNSFSLHDEDIYFLSDRSSQKKEIYNLFKMNLESGKIIQLTDEENGIEPSYHTKTPESDIIVYITGSKVKKIDNRTYKTTVLYEEKDNVLLGHPHISPNKKHIGLIRTENASIARGANYIGFKETMFATKKSWITIIHLDGTGVENIYEDTHWLGHFQFSPTDSNLAMFCHEGPWNLVHQRIWVLDIEKQSVTPIYRQNEHDCIGHEFWTFNGLIFFDNRRKGHDGTITVHKTQATILEKSIKDIPFVGLSNSKGVILKQYDLPSYCNHYHSNPNNTLLVGDEVEDLLLIHLQEDKVSIETLCTHKTSWNTQQTHCHPTFSWDGTQILFTSDRDGPCNLYLVKLDKEDGRKP